ncbi:MAG: DegT/DnrJ/EryC1/StrS family aminotransferase [Desulfovibrionaceae bacterium]|jgi:dTDP-4-amino-4,6-dideoxygalactose transaminase|nr:DegT/DnrJ/EryC1/StrS family aminotransferase [Desulfovibrionaceae bacterium]
MKERIFLSPPHMGPEEPAFVAEAFASNYIAPVGPGLTAFEQEMAQYLTRSGRDGEAHCVAVSSGTAALHLALRLAGVAAGDRVACSDLTFIGSCTPIAFQGATPVFIDAERGSWNMDPALAVEWLDRAAAGGRAPRALVLVHLYGQTADWDPIADACARHGVELVEDAAEALGATYRGRRAGLLGRFGILSFNGNKIITTGGGGMLVCRDADDADRARFLATQARESAPHYEHTTIGYNYRLSNVAAAIGRGQLMKLDERVQRRRRIFDGYVQRLGDGGAVRFMPEADWGRSNRWLTCCLFHADEPDAARGQATRERVRLALEAENIEARPVWKPMSLQPVYAGVETVAGTAGGTGNGTVGADLFARGLCLPSGTQMTDEDLDRICDVVRREIEG